MSDRYFIDTNIFVYSFEASDKEKQKKAQEIISRAFIQHQGVKIVNPFL